MMQYKNQKMITLSSAFFVCLQLFVCCSGICGEMTLKSVGLPTGIDAGPLEFDAIMKLHAPIASTYVVLFLRYYVSADEYMVCTLWAEPHIGSLNYATYPVTLGIHSTKDNYTLRNQVFKTYDVSFRKPIEKRGVFVYQNNNYSVADIRFGPIIASLLCFLNFLDTF